MEPPMEATNAASQPPQTSPQISQAPSPQPPPPPPPARPSAPVVATTTSIAHTPLVAGTQSPISTSNSPKTVNGLGDGNNNANKPAAGVAADVATTPAPAPAPASVANGDARSAAASSIPVSRPSPLMQIQTQTQTQPTIPSSSPKITTPVTVTSTSSVRQHQYQRPPMQQHRSSTGSHNGKVPIVEPPGVHSRQAQSQAANFTNSGFPSPNQDYLRNNSKFIDDRDRLTYAIQQSIPEAVRRVMRDNWEKCLLGSEFHHAFLLNAVIHHANGVIIRRAIKEFGAKMVSESKFEVMDHFQSPDLDEVADLILNKCSNYFLDKAMEKRLKTIDARSLINALARAERLGYENSDVLDDQRENIMPTVPLTNSNQNQRNVQSSQQRPIGPVGQGAPGSRPPNWQCRMCWRKFNSSAPYEYHVQKQVCTKLPPNADGFPFSCPSCGVGFTTKVGQQYHRANNVCGDHGTAPATPMTTTETGSPIFISSGNTSPVRAPSIPMPPSISSSSYYASTQARPSATPGVVSSKDFDPYGHLSQSTMAKLNEELRQAEASFAPRFKEAEAILDPAERKARVEGLHNSFSTKQSIIRKKFGVRLRNRRTRAEIVGERQRLGLKHASPSQWDETPSYKRQRTDQGPPYISSQVASSPNSTAETPSKHLAVSALNSGLGGSSATAAIADPTLPLELQQQGLASRPAAKPSTPSLSSYQRKGYRVSSHVPRPNQPSPASATPIVSPSDQRHGSASAPVVLDEDDNSPDSDSDSEEEIPASLPLGSRKTSGTPQKSLAG